MLDHDSLPNEDTLVQLRQLSEGTDASSIPKWIIGIEISSALPSELGGLPSSSLHIVGLFVDPYNEALRLHVCEPAFMALSTCCAVPARTAGSHKAHAAYRFKSASTGP